jgi:peroxiredoxin
MMRTCVAAIAMIAAVCVGLPAIAGEGEGHNHEHAAVGKPAPDFTLKDLDGQEHKLSDLKGKIVVLEWTNFNCPFVVRHQKTEHTMQHTFESFKDKGVVWLAIDSTNPDSGGGHTIEKIKNWANDADVKLPYPVLRDEDGKVGHLYGAKTTPHMFVINKEGVLVYEGAIDDDPHGKNDDSVNYVEEAVSAVLDGEAVEVASTKAYGCTVKYAG